MNIFRELRKEKGLTQLELAKRFNIDQTTVSKWEVGKVIPDTPMVIKLAEFYDVSTDYLLNRSNYYYPDNLNNETIAMNFSNRLTEILEEKGLTQKELATACNISTQCVSALITGRNSPTGTTVATLAKYFGCSADYLLGLTSDDDSRLYVAAPSGNAMHSSDETRLLEIYRKLSPDMRSTLWSLLETWSPADVRKNKV